MMNKKILLLMIFMIFLVGTASAELIKFDNVKIYDEETRTVTIKNLFGLGKTYAEVQLKSNLHVVVPPTYTNVSMFEITSYSDYTNFLTSLKYFNVRDNMKEVDKEVDIKYWGDVVVGDYIKRCISSTHKNGTKYDTNCYDEKVGEHIEKGWVNFTENNLVEGETITIGLFTHVKHGDKVEWLPKFAGVKVNEWAVWEGDLAAGLVSCWTLNEAAGAVIDSGPGGINDGINNGGTAEVPSPITSLGTGYFIPTGGSNISVADDASIQFTDDFTIGIVFNTSADFGLFNKGAAAANEGYFAQTSSGKIFWNVDQSDGTAAFVLADTPITTGNLVQALMTYDAGTNVEVYVNGTSDGISVANIEAAALDFNGDFFMGAVQGGSTGNKYIYEVFALNYSVLDADAAFIWDGGDILSCGGILDAPPTSTLNNPANDTIQFTPLFNLNGTGTDDIALQNMSLIVSDLRVETNASPINNTVTNFEYTASSGTVIWKIEACDSVAVCTNSSERYITFSNDLAITLDAPVNEFNSSSTTLDFNGTPIDDTAIVNVSFILNGTYNGTDSTITNNTLVNFERALADGKYNWTMETCDANFCVNATPIRNVTVDATLPDVLILFPEGEIDSFSIGDDLDLNWSINDSVLLHSCWFSYDGTNTSLTCGDSTTTFTPVLGVQDLTLYANDSSGNLGSDFTSWTYAFLETNVDFNAFVNETATEEFVINLTTDINILSVSAVLNYNGTNHITNIVCNSGQCNLTNSIDIPLVSAGEYQNKSFFWQIAIFNGTDQITINTTLREQNVTRIHLEDCSATFTDDTLNFTVYDEQTLIQLDPYNFNGTFEYWVGSGAIRRTNSSVNNSIEYKSCIKPIIEMKTDMIIDYVQNGSTNYTSRFYYLDDFEINSALQDIRMYLLLTSEATSFILKVQDDNLLPVADALIEIHRFYPGEGIFRIVQIAKTDDSGKSVGFFETETVDYKFIIKKDGETLLETGQQKVIPESSPFTLTFNIGEPLEEPWQSQEELDDLNSSLVYNNNTGIVTYTYIDSSGNFTLARLLVIKQSLVNSSNDTTICNTNLSIPAGTLICDVGSDDGYFVASSFITRNETSTLDLQFSFQIQTLTSVVGLLGLFFGWFLILVASFMFKFNEVAGIWAITITVFLVNIIGLIKFGGVFVTATIGLAIILTWLMER